MSGWSYDANGRLLASVEGGANFSFAYDAAGRMISSARPGTTINQSFDGDGLRAKLVENTTTIYYVRSSALSGQAVTEVNQYGQKVRGHVYAGGQAIAKQEGGQVTWDQRDVSGASMRITNVSGAVVSRIETDPLGTQVDDTFNYNYNGGGNGYGFNPNGFYGDPTRPNMGCKADGVPADCNWVARQIRNGVQVQCPQNNCGWRAIRNEQGVGVGAARFHASADGRQYFLAAGVNYVGNNTFRLPGGLFARVGFDQSEGRLGNAHHSRSPQKAEEIRVPIVNFKKLLQDTLAFSDCAEFLAKLIKKASELSKGQSNAVSTDIMTLYHMINRQPRGGFRHNHDGKDYYGYTGGGYRKLPPVSGGGGAAWGNWRDGNVTIWITGGGGYSDSPPLTFDRIPFEYALRAIHEIFHKAGENGYGHDIMNLAANELETGLSFNNAVIKHCIPRNMW